MLSSSVRSWILCGVIASASCAPTLVSGTTTNPAKSKDKLAATQEYDLGPYKENHRYTMTIKDWTPTSLGVEIKVADIDACGKTDSYSYTLVDDKGGTLKPAAAPSETTEKGAGSATPTVSTLDGSFDVPIGADTQSVTIEQRPKPDVGCPAFDFRWSLSG